MFIKIRMLLWGLHILTNQLPFQGPIDSRYLPYIRPFFRAKFQGIPPQFIWPNIWYSTSILGSWNSHWTNGACQFFRRFIQEFSGEEEHLKAAGKLGLVVKGVGAIWTELELSINIPTLVGFMIRIMEIWSLWLEDISNRYIHLGSFGYPHNFG